MSATLDRTTGSQAHEARRTSPALAAALVTMPAVLVAVLVCLPAGADARVLDKHTADAALTAAAAHPLGSWLGLLLVSVLYLLLVPVVFPLVRAVTGRGRRLVVIGYALTVLGSIGLAIENAAVAVALRAAIDPHVAHDAAVSFTIALQREHGPFTPLLWAGLGMFLGPIFLVAAAIRSDAVHWWQGIAVALLVLGMPLSQPGISGIAYLAVVVGGVVVLAALGIGQSRSEGGVR